MATFATTMHYERRSLQGIIGGEKQVNTCRSPLTSVVKLIPENLRGEWIIKDLQFQLHAITIIITWGKPLNNHQYQQKRVQFYGPLGLEVTISHNLVGSRTPAGWLDWLPVAKSKGYYCLISRVKQALHLFKS